MNNLQFIGVKITNCSFLANDKYVIITLLI